MLFGSSFKKPKSRLDDELHLRVSKLEARISKLTSVKGTGTPAPEQTSKLVLNAEIIGFLVIFISIESSASAGQGVFFMALNLSSTEPFNLSRGPGL